MRKIWLSVFAILALFGAAFLLSAVRAHTESAAAPAPAPASPPGPAFAPLQGGLEGFSSHLPLVIIDTGGAQILKDVRAWADIAVYDGVGMHSTSTAPSFRSPGTIRFRGNSSYYYFDKHSYRLAFLEDPETERDYAFLGLSAHNEWVLHGPFLDRTLVRNRLMFALSGELLPWSPDTRYFELFINGEYLGLFLAIEPITPGNGRLELTDFSLLSGETAYIIGRERIGDEENEFFSYGTGIGRTSNRPHVDYPKPHNILDHQMAYIVGDVNAFEEALYAGYFADSAIGYAKYIDVQSFIDYFLINELGMVSDASRMSTFSYKDIGGKLTMTVWDFNNAFNNYLQANYAPDDGFFLADGNWFDRLLQDRAFTNAVIARYRELRGGLWATERIMTLIDENIAFLGDAIGRNFGKWGYTFHERLLQRDSEGNSRDPVSYEDAVAQLKETITARFAYLDAHIDTLLGLCVN